VELQNVFVQNQVMLKGKHFLINNFLTIKIRYINDVINEHCNVLDYKTFCDTFPIVKINFLDYASTIQAAKRVQSFLNGSESLLSILISETCQTPSLG
jgi:hypothetical protein